MIMLPSKLFAMTTNVAGILCHLEESGIRLEIGGDFAKYRTYRRQQLDRGPIYAMFDVARSYVDSRNGFWICAFDANDELIHTQAVRLLDLSGVTLGTHLDDHRHKYITPDSTPDPDHTFYAGPEALHAITERVYYHGDFWLRARGLGGPRSQGATALLSRVLLELTVASWEPDFIFALVPKNLAAKGAHLRYGYCHCEPGRWIGPDQQVTEEDYLIWMGINDMANHVASAPQGLQLVTDVSTARPNLASLDASGPLNTTANA